MTVKTFRETRSNDELARGHLRLVWHEAHKFARQVRRGTESSYTIAEELASVGMVVLAKCLKHYDASRGIRFSTLLCVSLKREFARQLQLTRQQKDRGERVFPGTLSGLDVDSCLSIDMTTGPFDGVPVRQTIAARHDDGVDWCPDDAERRLRLALRSMPRRWVDTLVDRYIRGRHLHQIGRTQGVTRVRVQQVLELAIRVIQGNRELCDRVAEMAG